jgi:hypothetical protein
VLHDLQASTKKIIKDKVVHDCLEVCSLVPMGPASSLLIIATLMHKLADWLSRVVCICTLT